MTTQSRLPDQLEREKSAASRVTLIGMLLDALLGGFKCIVGVAFHSQALIVDGIHSFSDVLSDLVVLAIVRASRQAPDRDHPYGHQRFETMGTMFLGSILIALSGALIWDSLDKLIFRPTELMTPEWPVLVIAALSVLGKEWIYRYTRKIGEHIRSDLIIANAWHSRTDAFSSIIVLVAVAGAMLGFPWLDSAAAIIVALIVGHVGWQLAWSSVKELVDTALDRETTEKVLAIARKTPGVRNVHDLRSRRMGSDVLLDLHLQVSPVISVSEGHEIGVNVTSSIRSDYPQIRDVTFHIDAENDAEAEPVESRLPARHDVINALSEAWAGLVLPETLNNIRLHYLGAHVSVELFIHNDDSACQGLTTEKLKARANALPWLGDVRLWFRQPVQDHHDQTKH
ncbi:cation diffusion facilitator family transporter [Marinobacter sp. 1Y8]